MGVRTEADEHIGEALANVNEAIRHLSAIVIEQADGWDGYTDEYSAELQSALVSLLDIRKGL